MIKEQQMFKLIKEDKRKYLRLKVHHLIKYRTLSEGDSSFLSASIKDIGGGGICFRTERDLPLGTNLEIKISFPHAATSIFASAKVVWKQAKKRLHCFEVGCKFIDISESVRLLIDKQIKSVYSRLKK